MDLDPKKLKDWQIAAAAEENAKPIAQVAEEFGILADELIPFGRLVAKVDYQKVLSRCNSAKQAKYIDVTAITPTPLGEGKTTSTIGLIDGLAKLGKKVSGAIRQPSGGPTFNIKGSAAGGGLSQCIPLTPLSFGLTGDIDAISNAHNLAMVALTSRMQHENNYDDARLAKSNLKRLDIAPDKVRLRWVLDFCAQSLRNITIGRGGKMDGFEMSSGFDIAVSSEVMAILAMAKNLADLRSRIGKIVVAQSRSGRDITTEDLEVAGAMTAWVVKTANPNLLQTIEGQPVFVHAGPFANIAVGQSSVIADLLGCRLADYHITESGFASEIGYEKFWNLKCRTSGLVPSAVVIVATIRALKMHGGATEKQQFENENLALLKKGCENLIAHIEIVKKSGIKPVVCINGFYTDTLNEIALVKKVAAQNGAFAALSEHWLKGSAGAIELAEAVIDAAGQKNNFKYLYSFDTPPAERIELIAKEIYGADSVEYTPNASVKLEKITADKQTANFGICMAKTQLSLSSDPKLKGRPKGWHLPVSDILVYRGAGLIVPVAGAIKLMPGTASNPAFRKIDIDTETGTVKGLF